VPAGLESGGDKQEAPLLCNQKAFGETTWEMAAGARAWPDMNDVVMRDPKAKAGPRVLNNQQHMID
jgi:hypothetical protein